MHSPLFILSNDLQKPLYLFNFHSDALRFVLVRQRLCVFISLLRVVLLREVIGVVLLREV
jgi:hypothetical protein